MTPLRTGTIALALLCAAGRGLHAQQPVTRAQAVAAALARGARAALGRADTAAARGLARSARAFPNPLLSAGYTKDPPQYHAILDVPLDLPWLRAPRIGAAESARDAARYGFAFERAAIRFEVDTTYTRTLSADLHARLSRRTARDADSLLKVAELRRDAGDVSELDVRLAAVNAGQLDNVAVDDSLAAVDALLALQLQMGLAGNEPAIALADSLAPPPPADSATAPAGEPLPVAAAAAALRSEERAVTLAHRSLFAPSLELGVEAGDPAGSSPALLPTIGLAFPLPLFNWNGGEVARAVAARDRAQAELDRVRRETDAAVARARRELAAARARLRRDAGLLASADRVAAMSLQAYAEGAVALANVLEAQRNAREALGRYIDDLAAADVAAAALRLLTAAPEEP
ncbi:MAG TPA: TolC family protein [Gemmatimonadales bacterium]|jgi:cobalt-zinc-cadmium efflux system outer membrane protein|nr:TolC family protein [Gemmatimonadales bacterium]